LEGLQDRLRSVCLTAKKANFTEVEALYQTISQVHLVRLPSQVEEKKKKEKGKGKKEETK